MCDVYYYVEIQQILWYHVVADLLHQLLDSRVQGRLQYLTGRVTVLRRELLTEFYRAQLDQLSPCPRVHPPGHPLCMQDTQDLVSVLPIHWGACLREGTVMAMSLVPYPDQHGLWSTEIGPLHPLTQP